MVGVTGVEPVMRESKSRALPLGDTPVLKNKRKTLKRLLLRCRHAIWSHPGGFSPLYSVRFAFVIGVSEGTRTPKNQNLNLARLPKLHH